MKQLFFKAILFSLMLLSVTGIHAQTTPAKTSAAPSPTPQNVLAWAKEFSPKMEKEMIKIRNISPVTDADKKTKARFQRSAELAKEIISRGSKMSIADAQKYDAWFRLAMSESLDECLTQNPGSECCFAGQYQGQGWGSLWYRASCFTIRFPGID